MDHHQDRGRSLSMGHKNPALSPSHSPHPQYRDSVSGLGLDPSASASNVTPGSYNPNLLPPSSNGGEQLQYGSSSYLSPSPSQELPQQFAQNPQYSRSFEASFLGQLEHNSSSKSPQGEGNYSDLLNSNRSGFDDFPPTAYPNTTLPSEFDSSSFLDPQLHQQQSGQANNQSVNPADLVSRMSSPHNPSPPHLVPPESHSSPGQPSSPSSTPGNFYTPQHSRPTSLDPATAAYVTSPPQTDWQGMLANPSFQRHRRAPSEHSDVSSVSHSPFIAQQETFDLSDTNPSPLLSAENDPSLYDNALGMDSFTLSEHSQHGLSPGHSPYISPQLMPQPNTEMGQENHFNLNQSSSNQFPPLPPDMYVNEGDTMMFPNFEQKNPNEMGQAAMMAPPSINVELAPPSKMTNFAPPRQEPNNDALSPPIQQRSRIRSKSDPFGRPMSHQMTAVSVPDSLDPNTSALTPRSLSPFDTPAHSTPSSREPSPSAKNRRQSTSSIDNRNYILDLADPQRPGANPADAKRIQKHPATFQCNLCPKRFTRAYNLRSHLRTHTDERPFVCTVCGKAFARQHDRKRHEGLHSGEKKFVCRGDLSRSGQWGCGRRFARADALGRHFRSEAGRVCIKPLLDEEALERERHYVDQQRQHGHLQPMPQPMTISMDGMSPGFTLPAALLAQYPALQTLQWDQIMPATEDTSDIGGRSSFDASSGGEFGFGEDEESGMHGGYVNNPGPGYGGQPPGNGQWMSSYEAPT